jgi:hypothetical protein
LDPDPVARRRGELLLHPATILATIVLVANDHWLKSAYPGLLTGKLSDYAGLVLFPLLVAGLWELLSRPGKPVAMSTQRRALVVATIVTAVAFAAVKTLPQATQLYGQVIGMAQWIAAGPLAVLRNGSFGPLRSATTLSDPGDLIALPAVLLPYWLSQGRRSSSIQRRGPRLEGRARSLAIGAALLVAATATIATAPSEVPTPGPQTFVDKSFPVTFALSKAEPVAIRDLTVSETAANLATFEFSQIWLETKQAGVSVFVNDKRGLIPGPTEPTLLADGGNRFLLSGLDAHTTTVSLRVIVELTDLTLAPVTVSAVVEANTTWSAATAPADANVLISGLDGQSSPTPATKTADQSGEVTIDGSHPTAYEALTWEILPGTVADPYALTLDQSLDVTLESEGTDVSVIVLYSLGPSGSTLIRETGSQGSEAHYEVALPDAFGCPAAMSGCGYTYSIAFAYAGDATRSVRLHWHYRENLHYFASSQGSFDPELQVDARPLVSPAISTSAPVKALSGQVALAAGSSRAAATVIAGLGRRVDIAGECDLNATVSFSAHSTDGGQVPVALLAHAGTSVEPHAATVEFAADGQPHHIVIGQQVPVTVDWTLSV